MACIFLVDKLLDERADRRGGTRATTFGRNSATEKVLEFINTARSKHKFLRSHAGDGGFMQFKLFRDFAQHQRTHGGFTVLEKTKLTIDNSLRHTQNSIETLL